MTDNADIWVLTDDRPGNATQAVGVAETLGQPFVEKRLTYDRLAGLPNLVRGATRVGLSPAARAGVQGPPWPRLVIAAGRRTAPVARWIKRQADIKVYLAHLMNPGRAGAADFDLIALPNHDCRVPAGDAANVLRITGAPHRFSAAVQHRAAAAWAESLSGLPRPFIALVVGGATHRRPFPSAVAADLGARVAALARSVGGSVLLATSRRTGPEAEAALIAAIPEPRATFLWSRGGDNPYFGYLALADGVVVTGDSASMCSEACATPGPVWIAADPEITAPKHRRLHHELYRLGYARPFTGAFETWTHPPLNAAADVAAAIHLLLAKD